MKSTSIESRGFFLDIKVLPSLPQLLLKGGELFRTSTFLSMLTPKKERNFSDFFAQQTCFVDYQTTSSELKIPLNFVVKNIKILYYLLNVILWIIWKCSLACCCATKLSGKFKHTKLSHTYVPSP